MRICVLVILLILGSSVNARRFSPNALHELRRLLKENKYNRFEQRDSSDNQEATNVPRTVSYNVIPVSFSSNALYTQITQQAQNGYIYLRNVVDDSYKSGWLFAHVDGSTSTYDFHSLVSPSSLNDYVAQMNSEGANGYFFLTSSYVKPNTINIYVKDSSASGAKYTIKSLPQVATSEALVQEIQEQGADGYRFLMFGPSSSQIYIKDSSKSSTFNYITTPFANHTAEFQADVDELSAQGYRFSRVIYYYSPTVKNKYGFPQIYYIPLYYQDSEQTNSQYNYKAIQAPGSVSDFTQWFNEQGQRGLLHVANVQFYDDTRASQIFIDLNTCNCVRAGLDLYL